MGLRSSRSPGGSRPRASGPSASNHHVRMVRPGKYVMAAGHGGSAFNGRESASRVPLKAAPESARQRRTRSGVIVPGAEDSSLRCIATCPIPQPHPYRSGRGTPTHQRQRKYRSNTPVSSLWRANAGFDRVVARLHLRVVASTENGPRGNRTPVTDVRGRRPSR